MNTPDAKPPVDLTLPGEQKRTLHWPWFTLALLLPPILTFLFALADSEVTVVCAFAGSGIAGLVCGILLGRRLGKSTVSIVLLSLLFVVVFAVLCFALCFTGCAAGLNARNL